MPPLKQRRIGMDEMEAGSILVSLAKHSVKTMSIHNLVETNDYASHQRKFSLSQDQKHHSQPEIHSIRPSCDTPNNRDVQKSIHSDHHVGVQQLSMRHLIQQRHDTSQIENRHTCSHVQSGKHINQCAAPTPITNSRSHPSLPHNFPNQYAIMKRRPKTRRNALQAYISYMTYTDMTRKRMRQETPTTNIRLPEYVSPSPPLPSSSFYATPPNANKPHYLPSNSHNKQLSSDLSSRSPFNMMTPGYFSPQKLSPPFSSSPMQSYPNHTFPTSPPSSVIIPHSPVHTDTKLIVEKPLTDFLHLHDRIPSFDRFPRRINRSC